MTTSVYSICLLGRLQKCIWKRLKNSCNFPTCLTMYSLRTRALEKLTYSESPPFTDCSRLHLLLLSLHKNLAKHNQSQSNKFVNSTWNVQRRKPTNALCFLFIYFHLLGSRETKRGRESVHQHIHSLNVHNRQEWARPNPGAEARLSIQNGMQTSCLLISSCMPHT